MTTGLVVAAGGAVSAGLLHKLAARSGAVVAVDGGYRHCCSADLKPELLVGDMDSLGDTVLLEAASADGQGPQIQRLPAEKDDTDTLYAVKTLLQRGCRHILLTCALGGRLDHTLANLQTLLYIAEQGANGSIIDDSCCVQAFLPGSYAVCRECYQVFSIFSMDAVCQDIRIENAKYPLDHYCLRNTFPIGISNEFLDGDARISFAQGRLLLIRSNLTEG